MSGAVFVRLACGGGVEEIRGEITQLGIRPAFLRRLGPCATKEELESIVHIPKGKSVTRIFEKKMLLFLCVFKKNETSRPPPAPTSDNCDETPLSNGPTHPPDHTPVPHSSLCSSCSDSGSESARASSSHTRRVGGGKRDGASGGANGGANDEASGGERKARMIRE